MVIYKIHFQVNEYKSLLPEDEKIWNGNMLDFDGSPKGKQWKPPKMWCERPLLKTPDLWYMGTGVIAATPKALEAVQTMFEMAGELLPLPFEGQTLTVLNVTECINCLDQQKSKWAVTDSGERLYPKELVFHPNRFSESSLFKIPEFRLAEIFCVEREKDPTTEFKAAVDRFKLQGIDFEPVWSDRRRK